MKKPSLHKGRLSIKVGASDSSWTLFWTPKNFLDSDIISLFDNSAGVEYNILTDEDYAYRKQQVLQHEGQEAADKWELNTDYCTHNFVKTCLGVPYQTELKHMRRVWDALDLLVHIQG